MILSIFIYIRLTIKSCTSKVFMGGKVVIITGANSGLGLVLAKKLAARGARVILGCRSEERGMKARDIIIEETGNNNIVFKKLDLTSLSSARNFCDNVYETETRLDVLVNKAGVFNISGEYTADGIVEDMQVNVFGLFLLTMLLLPLLIKSKPSRIINMTSATHAFGVFEPENVNVKGKYGPVKLYFNGKLCNLLFSLELANHLKGTGVTSNAVHPGVVDTHLVDGKGNAALAFKAFRTLCFRTIDEGTETALYASTAKECENVSGKYFCDCEEWRPIWRVNNNNAFKFWECAKKLVNFDDRGTK